MWVALACWGMFLAGCESPSTLFAGQWMAVSEVEDQDPALLYGAPRLAIGHYGDAIAGVVYFHKTVASSQLRDDCPCAFVESQHIDTSPRTIWFSTLFEGEACPLKLELDWRLEWQEYNDEETNEPVMEGQVTPADGSEGSVTVRLVRQGTFVGQPDRVCEPP